MREVFDILEKKLSVHADQPDPLLINHVLVGYW